MLKSGSQSSQTNLIARLDSKNCGTLKSTTTQLINQILYQNNHVPSKLNPLIDEKIQDTSSDPEYLNESSYNESRPQIVVILEDFEGFSGSVLSDFCLLLSKYVINDSIPIVFVFGVATTLTTIHQSLSKSALQRLNIVKFSLGAVQNLLNDLTCSLFICSESVLNLSYGVYKYLVKHFIENNMSIYQFKKQLKYAYMDFYYSNPLSILSACIDNFQFSNNNFSAARPSQLSLEDDHLEQILMQPSVMRTLNASRMIQLLSGILEICNNAEINYQNYISKRFTHEDFSNIIQANNISNNLTYTIKGLLDMFESSSIGLNEATSSKVYTRTNTMENPYLLAHSTEDVMFEASLKKANATIPALLM
ncbi:Origin of replication complex subunit 3 [Smittium culicis]|uniref:Origin of replication complex subunit 3 n=1 Tax=Smittium culicis TaxID=133412 RepID=A0A1R1XGC8_9FUNG|nr:Origin of replication complex subunit 3 [Smittium culicis]